MRLTEIIELQILLKNQIQQFQAGFGKFLQVMKKNLITTKGFQLNIQKIFLQSMMRRLCSILSKDNIHLNPLKDGMWI